MPFEFCLRVPVTPAHPTGWFCVRIPVLVRMFPPESEPDPRADWSILATIAELAGRLTNDRGIDIGRSVAAQVEAVNRQLGDAAMLSLGTRA